MSDFEIVNRIDCVCGRRLEIVVRKPQTTENIFRVFAGAKEKSGSPGQTGQER